MHFGGLIKVQRPFGRLTNFLLSPALPYLIYSLTDLIFDQLVGARIRCEAVMHYILKKFDGDTHQNPRIQLLRLLSLCVAWRYLNYAIELADYGRREKYIDQGEFELMTKPWLNTIDLSDYLPPFYGRKSLARLFDSLSYMLNPTIKKSVPFPFNGLGNHWVVRRIGRQPSMVDLYCPCLLYTSDAADE